ncbi:rRNA adenine dimethylase [Flagelloscypha sp. PMI_526]|nr:rRNA adenine dimethylase [Flagelloscypha sp. PMI_526]
MPRATTDRFTRAHQPSAKAQKQNAEASSSSSSAAPVAQQCQTLNRRTKFWRSDLAQAISPVRILEKAKHVTAVEMDPRMAAELTKRVQGKPEQRKLDIIIGDFVKADLPYFDVCISNTPYQISSPLVFRLLSHRPIPRIAILMFQREFALHLSANVQLYATVDHIMKVDRNSFRPPPQTPPPPVRFEEFDEIRPCHANFMAKGVMEMLERNYRTWCSENDTIVEDEFKIKTKVENILKETGNMENRAAKMSVVDLLRLLSTFHDAGIHFA